MWLWRQGLLHCLIHETFSASLFVHLMLSYHSSSLFSCTKCLFNLLSPLNSYKKLFVLIFIFGGLEVGCWFVWEIGFCISWQTFLRFWHGEGALFLYLLPIVPPPPLSHNTTSSAQWLIRDHLGLLWKRVLSSANFSGVTTDFQS